MANGGTISIGTLSEPMDEDEPHIQRVRAIQERFNAKRKLEAQATAEPSKKGNAAEEAFQNWRLNRNDEGA